MSSWLPKTCPTTSVVFLDIALESASPGALFALATLQGLVNRTHARKVFLNHPLRDPSHPGVMPLEKWFEDGLIPYPVEHPALDGSKRYPALDWLLREHGSLLHGAVLTPPRIREHEGSIAAATTAAAFEHAIALTPDIAAHLHDEGWTFPVLGSTIGLDNLAALRWQIARYADDSRRNGRVMGFTHGGRPCWMIDYWVATYSFCFYLDARLPEESAAFAEILNPDLMPPGAILYGDVEGTDARFVAQQLGYTVSAGDLCNLSVTSSIPSEPARLRRPPAPRAHPVEPDFAFVGWNGLDGDCPVGVGAYGYLALREAPPEADAPIGLWFHPHMIDLFPTMAQWWSERGNGQLDIVASLNDGGVAPWTEEGRRGWRESYRSLMARSNGLFQVFNVFYETEDVVQDTLAAPLDWPFVILGYDPGHYRIENEPTRWKLLGNTVYCSQGCDARGSKGADAIRALIDAQPAGTPAFVMARLCGSEGRFLETATAAMRALRADPPAGRRLVFLPPRDLAATWRAWAEASRPVAPPSVWPGPDGARFEQTPLHPDAIRGRLPHPRSLEADAHRRTLPADMDVAGITAAVAAVPAEVPVCWLLGTGVDERAESNGAWLFDYAKRLMHLHVCQKNRPHARVAVALEAHASKEAVLRRYHLFRALEVAAVGAVDAFHVPIPERAVRIVAELRQFHSLRHVPVHVPVVSASDDADFAPCSTPA
ncbi:MAG: hypothetical protein ACOX5G_11650 [Kiritimatiellia bacterium]|jgi:hypothetical protein